MSYWPDSPPEVNLATLVDGKFTGWYEVNVLAEPFKLGKPLASCINWAAAPEHGKSMLGIWRLDDLGVSKETIQKALKVARSVIGKTTDAEERTMGLKQVHDFRPKKSEHEEAPPEALIAQSPRKPQPQAQMVGRPMSLDQLLGHFSKAMNSGNRGRQAVEVRHPFDGLFSDFLETSGPAQEVRGQDLRNHVRSPFEFLKNPNVVFHEIPAHQLHQILR